MNSNQKENIKVSLPSFISKITIDNTTYIVQTEEVSKRKTRVISRVFLEGTILFSEEADYLSIAGKKDFPKQIEELMEKLHKKVTEEFTKASIKKRKKKTEYFNEAMDLLGAGRGIDALDVLRKGLEMYPFDPLLMSYCGCLYSIVGKKHKEGIKMCRDAIKQLDSSVSLEKDVYYPAFYLNLGRAYLGAGKRRDAVAAFNLGLKADPKDQDIIKELKKLGSRRTLPVPFLKRNNPINKYMGLLIGKGSGQK
jgi:tetratricopeptide (TPR) repeat protein